MNSLKNKLIALGVVAGLATGVAAFILNGNDKDFLTIAERDAIIEVYNQQLTTIKNDCERDIRCRIIDGEKRVIFPGVKTKKDVINYLNDWVRDGDNPKYKIN